MKPNHPTWVCPDCYIRCAYGKLGCNDPSQCQNEKNINYLLVYSRDVKLNSTSIGIAEIAEGSKHDGKLD